MTWTTEEPIEKIKEEDFIENYYREDFVTQKRGGIEMLSWRSVHNKHTQEGSL